MRTDLDTESRTTIANDLIPEAFGIDRFLFIWMGRDEA
jgi:hypothetical protein